jgi:hypothetical protein
MSVTFPNLARDDRRQQDALLAAPDVGDAAAGGYAERVQHGQIGNASLNTAIATEFLTLGADSTTVAVGSTRAIAVRRRRHAPRRCSGGECDRLPACPRGRACPGKTLLAAGGWLDDRWRALPRHRKILVLRPWAASSLPNRDGLKHPRLAKGRFPDINMDIA